MGERYWPFPILKPEAEWTELDRDFIGFMRQAYAEGFRPREGQCMSVDADSSSGRTISLVRRGLRQHGWEPFMSDGDRSVRLGKIYHLPLGDCECVCIRWPFRAAARFALSWLRGKDLDEILADYEFVGGRPPGILLKVELLKLP